MQATAMVNYHVTSDQQQAFHIDANGEKGKIVSPELAPTQVKVKDVRDGNIQLNFWDDSLLYVQSPSVIKDFTQSQDWRETYSAELSRLLAEQLGAKEVIIFDHTIRIDDPNSERKPARNVHSDYSACGAIKRLEDILGAEEAKKWQDQHFAFVNLWRPIQAPIVSAPLGFIRPKSVSEKDWLLLKLIYPDRIGQIMGLTANAAHEWIYLSNMTPDDIAIFNIFDSKALPSIGHSALDVMGQNNQAFRRSIESRTLVRY